MFSSFELLIADALWPEEQFATEKRIKVKEFVFILFSVLSN